MQYPCESHASQQQVHVAVFVHISCCRGTFTRICACPSCVTLQVNRAEEKSSGGSGDDEGRSTSNSPSRHRGFQRRLAEASAEVSAESAAATQIASTTNAGDAAAAAVKRRGGGGSGGSGRRRWTEWEDRVLERLVRECVFDFDLVAARISSSVVDGDRDEGE